MVFSGCFPPSHVPALKLDRKFSDRSKVSWGPAQSKAASPWVNHHL